MTLAEQLAAKVAELEAILNAAETEDRLLSDDEKAEADVIEAEIAQLKAGIEQEEADRKALADRKAKVAAAKDFIRQPRGRISPPAPVGDTASPGVPAFLRQAYRNHTLRSFSGPDAADQAYYAGQFFLASLWGRASARTFCEQHGMPLTSDTAQLAASGDNNSKGGYLVPDFLANSIIDLRETRGVFRANARRVAMPRDTYTIPRRTGGVTAYFVGQNSEITESDKTWDAVTLTARKLAALCKYSSEISEDSIISIADDLTQEIAYAFADTEDKCGFLGTGALATYGGISGLITACAAATATVYTTITGNTAFSTLDLADFEAMIGQLPSYAERGAKWYISKAGWAASMKRLTDAAGGITGLEMTNGVPVQSFLGFPVVFVPVMNSTLTAQTSTAGICYFGDLTLAATMGERRGMEVMSSSDRYFEYDQIAVRGTQRFDIVCHDVGDTSNAGAVVMMTMAGS